MDSKLIDNVKEKLSELVNRRLRELQITKADLARSAGVSRSYITNIANDGAPTRSGQYNLSPQTVTALAKGLEVSESEILATMGYLPEPSTTRKPQNVAEFFQALDDLGLDIQLDGGVTTLAALDADDLQELLDSLVAQTVAKAKRKRAKYP